MTSKYEYWNKRYKDSIERNVPYTWCTEWDNYYMVQKNNIEFMKTIVEKVNAKSVLDYGCGYADYNEVCEDYTGVDIIPELIHQNCERYPSKKFNVLPCQFSNYDLIFSIAVMHYLEYNEFKRYVSLFARHCKWFFMWEVSEKSDDHTIHRTNGDIIDTVEYYGFKIAECKDRKFLFEYVK
jgi:SAM-dependent methyltransferase